MTYYNQNDYPHIPYPAKGYESATVKTGGCGVCCSATVLSFFGVDLPPNKLAPIFMAAGIRVPGGTDMYKAAKYICDQAKTTYSTTSDEKVLTDHLRGGGIAVANTDGDVGAKGVFSSGGHYIVVLEARSNGDFVVFDVGYYPGKYDSAYRKDKVKMEGKLQVCSTATLNMDTLNRNPSYYLFKGKEAPKMDAQQPSSWAEEAWNLATEREVMDGTNPKSPLTREQLAVVLLRLGLIK